MRKMLKTKIKAGNECWLKYNMWWSKKAEIRSGILNNTLKEL